MSSLSLSSIIVEELLSIMPPTCVCTCNHGTVEEGLAGCLSQGLGQGQSDSYLPELLLHNIT